MTVKMMCFVKSRKAKLWSGSELQAMHTYVGVSRDYLVKRIQMKEDCDDLTKDEKDFLSAMKADLEVNDSVK